MVPLPGTKHSDVPAGEFRAAAGDEVPLPVPGPWRWLPMRPRRRPHDAGSLGAECPGPRSSPPGQSESRPRAWLSAGAGLRCMTMTEIVLRVRLISGEYLDVTYDEADGTAGEAVDHIIASLAADNGTLRCRHGKSAHRPLQPGRRHPRGSPARRRPVAAPLTAVALQPALCRGNWWSVASKDCSGPRQPCARYPRTRW